MQKVCEGHKILEHVLRELYERHPTACGNVNSANDLDLGLVDTTRPDSPSGVDLATVRGLLEKLDQRRRLRKRCKSHVEELVD